MVKGAGSNMLHKSVAKYTFPDCDPKKTDVCFNHIVHFAYYTIFHCEPDKTNLPIRHFANRAIIPFKPKKTDLRFIGDIHPVEKERRIIPLV